MRRIASFVLLWAGCLTAQGPAAGSDDQWKALAFLEGTWEAKTAGDTSGAAVAGTYTFAKELNGHLLARHSRTATCKGPSDFDCEHGDLLYVYGEGPAKTPRAIYFDNEGHVIHYGVSTPGAGAVVFLSDGLSPGPQFRLTYELKDKTMAGKFQVQMPGQTEWRSYLEWSGMKK